jgi:uncharacterized RDD family membrane protein YckC
LDRRPEAFGMNAGGTNQTNPYAPPSSDVNAVNAAPAREGELAERGTRFVAKMLDGFMAVVLILPATIAGLRSDIFRGGYVNLAFFRSFLGSGIGMASGVAWLALLAFQAYLTATTGQSLGKRWLKIKIVRLDGSAVNFATGVLLRHWLFVVLQYLPGVGSIIGLVDILFIFRQDRRCIHDFTAGTKVIQLKGAVQIRVA